MSSTGVRAATAAERDRFISTILLAFVRDPVTRWVWPSAHTYASHYATFANTFGGKAFDHESAYVVDDFSGAALWLPPGVAADEAPLLALLEKTVEPARQEAVLSMLQQMGSFHPHEPHWYLPLIGVDPAKQGRGHGAALLRHALERVDRDSVPAYLESTNPANVPLYQRHGFEVVDTIQVDDGPPMYPMVRPRR